MTDESTSPAAELLETHESYPPLVQLLAAAGAPLKKTRLANLVRHAGVSGPDGRPYRPDSLMSDLDRLIRARVVRVTDDGYECVSRHRFPAFRAAALDGHLRGWRDALWEAIEFRPGYSWTQAHSVAEAVRVVRIALCTRTEGKDLESVMQWTRNVGTAQVLGTAFGDPFDPELMELLAPAVRDQVAEQALIWALYRPVPSTPRLVAWCEQRVRAGKTPDYLRLRLCESCLWQGRFDAALALLEDDDGGFAWSLRSAAAAMQRQDAQASELFARARDALRAEQGRKNPDLPLLCAWTRAASLITGGDRAALEDAKRLCRAEVRGRGRTGGWLWDPIAAVVDVRLGDRSPAAVELELRGDYALVDLLTLEAYAWLRRKLTDRERRIARQCADAYAQAGFLWMAREIEAAIAVCSGKALSAELARTLAAAFAGESEWRRALGALAGIGDTRAASGNDTRLVWNIVSTGVGEHIEIEPWEQKRGTRGWSRGKRASAARLARAGKLDPRDANVCHAVIRVHSNYSIVDADRALPALIGHPLVFFDGDFGAPVELVAGEPELIVERGADGMRVRTRPDLRAELAKRNDFADFDERPAGRQPDVCLLVREGPTRARVLRITPAHRRVAELVGARLDIPPEGADELARAVASVARFFAVHSDVDAGVPESAGDGTIRAELQPAGEGLRLRLSVRPFGEEGPRFAPGEGGERVIAEVGGVRRAVLRDLALERGGLERVIEVLPLAGEDEGSFEWRFQHPQDCLALIEALQGLGDTVRCEWPAGKKFQVSRAHGTADLKLEVRRQKDWFVAAGGVQLDDGTVADMSQLIEFARRSRSRFVPLGEGGFLALTEDLRRRIDELACAAEIGESGLSVHPLAVGAIEEILEGARLDVDAGWRVHMERVREAQSLEPAVPATLQAELRPYQLEGFRWLMRLAHWGAGACLADDMGLGKTVQALAVLASRAAEGAALVIAPTSVCGNWIAETQRFAPALRLHAFGTGDRRQLVAAAGPGDVVVCSYALLQQESALFAARDWHTVVIDEAQAIKNFTTKRAQAVLALNAGFRIATTGTPVENRLEELWTLFRFLNPGLLGSRERFNERFAGPIERNHDTQARARLRRLVRPFVLRRTKSEVLTELPPRTEITLTVEPDAREQAFHEALRRSALAAIEESGLPYEQRRFRVLAELMRMRRACCDPRLVAPDAGFTGAKIEAFALLVEELVASRHRALVFSQFVDYLALLRAELDRMQVSYQYLDGATPAAERSRRVNLFQSGAGDLFLISLRAGGFGLNLTGADYVIIVDPWWNPAVEDQAAGRAHRMGQERPVTVYRLVMKDSIEERIMGLHRDKRALAEGLFTGEEFGGAVSVEDLMALMRER